MVLENLEESGTVVQQLQKVQIKQPDKQPVNV